MICSWLWSGPGAGGTSLGARASGRGDVAETGFPQAGDVVLAVEVGLDVHGAPVVSVQRLQDLVDAFPVVGRGQQGHGPLLLLRECTVVLGVFWGFDTARSATSLIAPSALPVLTTQPSPAMSGGRFPVPRLFPTTPARPHCWLPPPYYLLFPNPGPSLNPSHISTELLPPRPFFSAHSQHLVPATTISLQDGATVIPLCWVLPPAFLPSTKPLHSPSLTGDPRTLQRPLQRNALVTLTT